MKNVRGDATREKTMRVLNSMRNHAGQVRGLSLTELARRVGVTQRHMQNVMDALEAAGHFTRKIGRGVINVYQLILDWARAMIEGEARAESENAAASDPAPAPVSPLPTFLDLWKRRH